MKQCPRCNKTYTDDSLNFCLDDGELLRVLSARDEPPPTMILDQARVTNPVSWPQQPQPPAQWQQQNVQYRPPQYLQMLPLRARNQTIPTLALILGIFSLPMCWCGWLGLPAAILGFVGLRNADADPETYGGRGMAIAGLILGAISLIGFLLFIIAAVASPR